MPSTEEKSRIMDKMINNLDISTLIAAFISFFVSIYIFKTTPKYDLVLKRYEILIFPLFNKIEPYFFAPVSSDILDPLLEIIENNKSIAGGRLNELLYFCQAHPSQENFNSLCRQINTEYDRCCRRLGLKRRSTWYRIARKQYQTKFVFILFIVKQICLLILAFILFLLVLVVLTSIFRFLEI